MAEFDADVISERYGEPIIGVHRADLHAALIETLGSARIRTGRALARVEDGRLVFEDGETVAAEVVVGADGIESTVRRAIRGDGAPDDSGIVAFRGIAPQHPDAPAGESWGDGVIAGLLPLRDGRIYWFVAHRGEPDRGRLRELASAFADPLPEIVASTPADQVLLHSLYDRKPSGGWAQGNVALLGDAAHPMLPFLGQGACAALEDAVCIGECLEAADDVPAGLAAYEHARVARAKFLVKGSAAASNVALPKSGFVRAIRNVAFPRVPESVRLRQMDRVIGRP
jgi:2-polyprenyl-6-methoxyphenol hydroxylase-like FAD-dependent oxidoreductase